MALIGKSQALLGSKYKTNYKIYKKYNRNVIKRFKLKKKKVT